MNQITSINDTNRDLVLLLINASCQAYNAFNSEEPQKCQVQNIIAPKGFVLIDSWTGVDSIYNHLKSNECYGIVFRSLSAPYAYIFAFRGTDSFIDGLDDLGAQHHSFKPYDTNVAVEPSVKVESGFYDIYNADSENYSSMRDQLFSLVDKYATSDNPLERLYITGHSLGSALSELFTLDVAISRPLLSAVNINFACPCVGNEQFIKLYNAQSAQKNINSRTLRVVNYYDAVPRVPFENMGYEHLQSEYIIAFYRDAPLIPSIGKGDVLANHSSYNYLAVLECAAKNQKGICVNDNLYVKSNDYSIISANPEML